MKKIRLLAANMLMAVATTPAVATAASNFATVYHLNGAADGLYPIAPLLNVGGVLYGTSTEGGSESGGTLFKFDPSSRSITTLHSFNAFGPDGNRPVGRLIEVNGGLYGVTQGGGASGVGAGAVYRFDLVTFTESIVYSFGQQNGTPNAGLVYHNGYLYGTSEGDTIDGISWGSVYRINLATGAVSFIYNFSGGADGSVPAGDLAFINGSLYGTTVAGGVYGSGVIFKVNPASGSETVLHDFGSGSDGKSPFVGLSFYGGQFYGTTASGGSGGAGTVFKFDPVSGTESVLYNFTGGADGGTPLGADLVYLNGRLYGGTGQGGSGRGAIFVVDASTGVETVLHLFQGGSDGAYPDGGVTFLNKRFYGITAGEGISTDYGTLFELQP